jgi:predicted DNA binding CopG/RHH family protein
MKKEYDLRALKKRSSADRVDQDSTKVPVSLRIDGVVLANIKTEAMRLGIPYQTLISSILYRFSNGDLVDLKSVNIDELIKKVS